MFDMWSRVRVCVCASPSSHPFIPSPSPHQLFQNFMEFPVWFPLGFHGNRCGVHPGVWTQAGVCGLNYAENSTAHRAHTHISLPHVLEQLFLHCRVRRASLSCTRVRTRGFQIEPPVRFQHCNECGKLVKLPCRTHWKLLTAERQTHTERERPVLDRKQWSLLSAFETEVWMKHIGTLRKYFKLHLQRVFQTAQIVFTMLSSCKWVDWKCLPVYRRKCFHTCGVFWYIL